MRAAIYARYSSDKQSDASIDDQIRLCREYASRHNWHVAAVFADHALSGTSNTRPEYQKLVSQARARKFDIVVAEAMDRLSRDQEHIAGLYKTLSFAETQLVTLAEGTVNELHIGLKGTMNALYIKDLAAKTHRGLRGRVEQGRSGGGLCYGYDVVRQFNSKGEPIRGERTINEAEAAIVRRIFEEYVAGYCGAKIARRLNHDGVPGPRGKTWSQSTINGNRMRGTGILNNELYIGRLVWNRLRYVMDPHTGKRISRENPESELIVTEVPSLRLMNDELWNAVRGRQEEKSRNTRPRLQ